MSGLIRKKRARIAAVMQLLALFVLQVALLTPPIAIALATAKPYNVCQGDHALCGCPPSRIAAGTCCCAIAKRPACCQKETTPSQTDQGPAIASLPCGISDPVILQTVDVFLMPRKIMTVALNHLEKYPPTPPEYPIHQYPRPQIPPPKISPVT